jgi:hypothetical protein
MPSHPKTSVVVVITAALAFAVGFWTKGTLATSVATASPSTISPLELHRAIRPAELPSQHGDLYN